MSKKHNRVGERYGYLEITGREERTHKNGGGIIWLATCHLCGNENYPVITNKITKQGRIDCGCQRYARRTYPLIEEDCSICGESFKRRSNSTSTVCSAKCKQKRVNFLKRNRLFADISAKTRAAAGTARTKSNYKNIPCDITSDFMEFMLIENDYKCSKTGISFTGAGPFTVSIDRIDSDKGYTKDNVQLVCWIYNRCKSNNSHEDVIAFAKALLKREEEENEQNS